MFNNSTTKKFSSARTRKIRTRNFESLEQRMVMAGDIQLVTKSVDNNGGGNGYSSYPSMSFNGDYIVFSSYASDLVPGDYNDNSDVFVRNVKTGVTQLVSCDVNGVIGNSYSTDPSISGDGRHVVFQSFSNNLLPESSRNYGSYGIFKKDLTTGIVTLVSTDSNGEAGTLESKNPAISANGRYVVFESEAPFLVPEPRDGNVQIYVKDTETGLTRRVSTSSTEVVANGYSTLPSISADGRYVVFQSNSDNLVANDTTEYGTDIYVKDLQTGQLVLANCTVDGIQGDEGAEYPSISADGRFVTFESRASNLTANNTYFESDIYLKDLLTGNITNINTNAAGEIGNGDATNPVISGDGNYVIFESRATNLTPGKTNAFQDVFVKNVITGEVAKISSRTQLSYQQEETYTITINFDGSKVAFLSDTDNLPNQFALKDIYYTQLITSLDYVIAELVNGDLYIRGNNSQNHVKILPGANPNEYRVVGFTNANLTQTIVNGELQSIISNVTGKIIVELFEGNDIVTILNVRNKVGAQISTGDGDDNVTIGFDEPIKRNIPSDRMTIINGLIEISTDEGNDSIFMGRLYGAASQTINTGDGNDSIKIYNASATNVNYQTGSGDDQLSIGYLTVNGTLDVDSGSGNDLISFYCNHTLAVSNFVAGAGFDTIALDVNNFEGDFFADSGADDDTLLFARSIFKNGSLSSGIGADNAIIGKYYDYENGSLILKHAGSSGNSLTLDMGSENDKAEMAANIIDSLFANFGDGDDEFAINNNSIRDARLNGGLGRNRLTQFANAFTQSQIESFE